MSTGMMACTMSKRVCCHPQYNHNRSNHKIFLHNHKIRYQRLCCHRHHHRHRDDLNSIHSRHVCMHSLNESNKRNLFFGERNENRNSDSDNDNDNDNSNAFPTRRGILVSIFTIFKLTTESCRHNMHNEHSLPWKSRKGSHSEAAELDIDNNVDTNASLPNSIDTISEIADKDVISSSSKSSSSSDDSSMNSMNDSSDSSVIDKEKNINSSKDEVSNNSLRTNREDTSGTNSKSKKKPSLIELEQIRSELQQKELLLLSQSKELQQKEQTVMVLQERLEIERRLRDLLIAEKDKAMEEVALARGFCGTARLSP